MRTIHHLVELSLTVPSSMSKFDEGVERKERAVLNTALELRPTLKEVSNRVNNPWRLDDRGIWEAPTRPKVITGTEDGGMLAYYL